MTVVDEHLRIRQRDERKVFVAVTVAAALVAAGTWTVLFGAAYSAYLEYEPMEGDLVFQSLPHSALVNAIEGATDSPFSHCGIVANRDGQWCVVEAFRGVEVTPLREFIFRGRNQGFAIFRLHEAHRKHIPAMIDRAGDFIGRPYDSRYRLDDERIYCSELIYKACEATPIHTLGELVQLQNLRWEPFRKTIQHFEGGPVPLERKVITPKDIARDSKLACVFVHAIEVKE